MLLSDGLACAAVERPYEEAIAFGDRRLTWSEWHERIRRVAGALAAEGIGRGDRVAVIDRNHIAVLDVILAAGTLGAATVVPNWRLKDAELSYVHRPRCRLHRSRRDHAQGPSLDRADRASR
jgi:acyl-CoA synthetase (AMP-forming)/AMP-acid ligase II